MNCIEHQMPISALMISMQGIADAQCPVLTSTGACTKRNQAVSGIRKLQEKIDQLQTEQAESARYSQLLNDMHANLEPLLSRLRALLNGDKMDA